MNSLRIKTENNQRYLWFDGSENYTLLKSFYPRFYDRILEMQEILKAEGSFIDEAQIAFEIVLNNMFINYMDEDAVKGLEDFLGIIPLSKQTLDDRKEVLISHFRGYGKMSSNRIAETSEKYNLTAETTFDEQDSADNFLLRIKLYVPKNSDEISDYDNCIKTLEVRLPAHLKRFYEVIFDTDSKVGIAFVSVLYASIEHESEEADVDNLAYFVDELGDMLLDEDGNVLLDEEV
ncbi:MAG: DUF2313 domain-containing protein [Eubacterium sp.]|nr:DUF2313 domain-containing protein [Eubacterium sp.]